MSTSGDVESISSLPNSLPGSPRSKVKFLCSHGGKILPRPADGHLKYVGGETRVISVPRDITLTDLMKKLASLIEGDMILKYQLIPEELDALVSVKSDEDLRHMFEEYDRQGVRLRSFLFPANPSIVMENQLVGAMDRHSLEQRYINSVNGIVVQPVPVNTSTTTFSISSACSSPRTPPLPEYHVNPEITTLRGKLSRMPRARSSPTLCNLAANYQTKNPSQQHPPYHRPHQINHPHTHPHPQPHPYPYPSPKPPLDHKSCGPDQMPRVRSSGLTTDYYYRHPHQPNRVYQRPLSSPSPLPYDDYYGNTRYDRTESPPGSPLAPHDHATYISKWD